MSWSLEILPKDGFVHHIIKHSTCPTGLDSTLWYATLELKVLSTSHDLLHSFCCSLSDYNFSFVVRELPVSPATAYLRIKWRHLLYSLQMFVVAMEYTCTTIRVHCCLRNHSCTHPVLSMAGQVVHPLRKNLCSAYRTPCYQALACCHGRLIANHG